MNNTGLVLDAHSINELQVLAKKAEDAGFHSVWATELYRSSFHQIAAAASKTDRIKLGTSVSLAFTRSPLITALTAMDLDELSNGRLIVGLGSGAKRTNEKFHSVEYGKPVKHITECIEVIRDIVSKAHLPEDIRYEGEYYKIDMRGYKRPFKPLRDRIPVYMAGIGSNMTAASGKIADGYIGHVVCTLEYLKEITIPGIESGLEESDKSRDDFVVSSIITCAVSDDVEKARRAAKATIAFYALVKTYEKPFELHGFLPQTKKIRDAYFRGDTKSMVDNVTNEMVDTFSVVGDEDHCRYKIDEYRQYLDLPILSVPHYFIEFDEIKEYQDRLLEVFSA